MEQLAQQATALVESRFPEAFQGKDEHVGQVWVFVDRNQIVEVLTTLRDELGFDMLMDLTAVDYLDQGCPERFAVVYFLYSLQDNTHFRVKSWVPENEAEIDTISSIWAAANWAEREVFDMFGISFKGHPDLKRILLPEGYTGHPLQKDYPITGRGERHDFSRYEK